MAVVDSRSMTDVYVWRGVLKSCTRFRNQLDFQLISDFKLDFSDFQAPEINGDLAKMLV